MRTSKFLIFILAMTFLGGESLMSQTFAPLNDAYVRANSYANINYGTNATLVVKESSVTSNNRKSYLKFDLTGQGITTVTSAIVRLYASTTSAYTIGAYQTTNTWSEATVTWANGPVSGALISSTKMGTANTWYQWNITAYVNSQLSAGNFVFSIVLRDVASAGQEVIFNSKEASTNKPQLVVVSAIATVPATPTALAATTISSSQINLSWIDNASNETGYLVESKTGIGTYTQIASLAANATSFSNTSLAQTTAYSYKVRAFNTTGNSIYSTEATATTLPTPPAAPTTLSATVFSSNQINLSWADVATNETGYKLERKVGTGVYNEIASLAANATSFSNTSLLENTLHTYRVVAFNSGGNSPYSNEATATTPVTLPNAPTGLTATALSSNQINLSWIDNAANETGYIVESKTGTATYNQIASLGPNVTTFNNTGLTASTAYSYRVVASNSLGKSAYSNEATATTQAVPTGVIYYIDAVAGLDANNGTSAATPWKNLTKLNSLTLISGTQVLLKAGSVWTGQQLKFSGSGNATSSIVINQYGTGAKPIINGNGLVGQAPVYLYNQQYIEINNLEITNAPRGPVNSDFFLGDYSSGSNPLGADRRGVMVVIDNYGTANHIYLKNLDIHHIKGQLGSGESAVNGAVPKRTGGIFFTVLGATESSSSRSRFNDILIDGCQIYYCENMGLAFDNEWNVYYPGGQNSTISADVTEYNNWFARKYTNVKISNNVLHHIGKNAMIIRCTDETGLVEKNVCYETALGTTGNTMFTARAKGTVFQFNEGYLNRATTQTVIPGNIDGSMYDADYGSVDVIFQYSYSHDNSQGLYWGCNTRGSANNTSGVPDPGDKGVTVRYNVSQNDKGDVIFFNYPSAGNEIYNNTIYLASGLNSDIIHESGKQHTYNFFNNIIYNLSSTVSYAFKTDGSQNRTISNNLFYGIHPSVEPADPFKITANPLLVNPGSATFGIGTLNGYKLQATSPAINVGKVIANNGGFDYWGTALYNGLPDIGADEYNAIGLRSASGLPITKGMMNNASDRNFAIYPNPFKAGSVSLRLSETLINKDVEASIISPDGKILFVQKITVISKNIKLTIPASIQSGMNRFRITSKGIDWSNLFIINP